MRDEISEGIEFEAAGLLRVGLGVQRAAATLHMLTGLDTFRELRGPGGLGLEDTIRTIRELAEAFVRPEQWPTRAR